MILITLAAASFPCHADKRHEATQRGLDNAVGYSRKVGQEFTHYTNTAHSVADDCAIFIARGERGRIDLFLAAEI